MSDDEFYDQIFDAEEGKEIPAEKRK